MGRKENTIPAGTNSTEDNSGIGTTKFLFLSDLGTSGNQVFLLDQIP